MESLNIYIQKSIGISDSVYYKSSPNSMGYIWVKQFGIITKSSGFKINFWLKLFVKKLLGMFNVSISNAYLTKDAEKYDLVYCAHCLNKNKKQGVLPTSEIEFELEVIK